MWTSLSFGMWRRVVWYLVTNAVEHRRRLYLLISTTVRASISQPIITSCNTFLCKMHFTVPKGWLASTLCLSVLAVQFRDLWKELHYKWNLGIFAKYVLIFLVMANITRKEKYFQWRPTCCFVKTSRMMP